MPRTLLIALLSIAAVVTACGSSTPAASSPCSGASPPQRSVDPELASRLPAQVADQELEVQTFCAATLDSEPIPLSPTFLEEVGLEREDVTMAVAQPPSMGGDAPFVSITAYRYFGADEATIERAFRDTLAAAGIEVEEDEIAGESLLRVLFVPYYVAGDTLYAITAEDPQVEEIIEALP